MLARTKIKELLSHLNDTEKCSTPASAQAAVSSALQDAKEVIELFQSHCGHLTPRERSDIGSHLWADDVEQRNCRACPYATTITPWQSALNSTQLGVAWQRLATRDRGKPADWSAAKFLSIYLSLTGLGFDEGKVLPLKIKSGRLILDGGNNRCASSERSGNSKSKFK